MRIRSRLFARLRAFLRFHDVETDLDREIHAHLALMQDELERRGLSADEARRRARLALGGTEPTKERHRDERSFLWLEDLRRDVPYAVRGLRRNPGFALAAVVTLALGIGAATAIYSTVRTILLTPLPYPESDRLVRLSERVPPPEGGRPPRPRSITYEEFLEWRTRTKTLSTMAALRWDPQVTVSTPQGAARLSGGLASPEWFEMLGVQPMLGRTLQRSDVVENRDVVVLSARAWRQHFGSDPQVIGRTTTLQSRLRGAMNGRPMEIIGVMPDGFEDPASDMEFWMPMVMPPPQPGQGVRSVQVIGLLAPGVTTSVAQEEANTIGTALRLAAGTAELSQDSGEYPFFGTEAPRRIDVIRLKDGLAEPVRPALRVLLAAVGVVLLIVCTNVASLLIARGTARHREIAVRLAIGAGRGRIIRQLLCETLVLSIAGGLLGAVIAALGITTIKSLATVDAPGVFRLAFGGSLLPRLTELTVDGAVLILAVGLSIITSALFGVGPALHVSRADHLHLTNVRAASSVGRESRLRSLLVFGQLVMATVLLVGGALLAHSFVRLSQVNTGYDPANVLAFQLVLPEEYPTVRKTGIMEEILTRLRAVPGVEAAGFSYAGALVGVVDMVGYFVPPGQSVEEIRDRGEYPHVRSVSHDYLPALSVRVLDGRGFTAADEGSGPPVVLINRAFARKFFGEASPVGTTLVWHGSDPRPGHLPPLDPLALEIVGVVDDMRHGRIDQEPAPQIFFDYRQLLAILNRWGASKMQQEHLAVGFMSFGVRTLGDPEALGPAVRAALSAADPNAGLDAMAPLARLMSTSIARPRFYAVMLGLFAAVAGLLALLGVYGVMAYAVLRRTNEIGVRMALGAEPRAVLALVLRQGVAITMLGIGFGVAGAVGLSRYLSTLLFGLTPLDPLTYLVVAIGFAAVATLAAYLPARRAMRIDPAITLRCE